MIPETYSQPTQISKMQLFAKIVNGKLGGLTNISRGGMRNFETNQKHLSF